MADQFYLENIDEFVMDQNKIVSSEAWGARACPWGPGPGRARAVGPWTPLRVVAWVLAEGNGARASCPGQTRNPPDGAPGARTGRRPLRGRAGGTAHRLGAAGGGTLWGDISKASVSTPV